MEKELLYEKEGYRLWVAVDENDLEILDPRDWDNLGTFYHVHPRYDLGNCRVDDYNHLLDKLTPFDGYDEPKTAQKWFRANYIIIPVYLMDHSGLSISWNSFGDPWDSGQVGWYVVSKEEVRKEYGWERLTVERISKVKEYMRSELETYNQWLTGDVWYYCVENPEGEIVNNGTSFGREDEYQIRIAKETISYDIMLESIKSENETIDEMANMLGGTR